jgi:hypothetical protein
MTVPPSKPSVLTLSIHHHAPLFFPSGEGSRRTAPDTPTPHTLSLPLAEGTSAASFSRAWASVEQVKRAWRPDFVVVCCGVDGLAGDGKGVWNLSTGEDPGDLGWAVRQICDWQLGTVLLGGGASAACAPPSPLPQADRKLLPSPSSPGRRLYASICRACLGSVHVHRTRPPTAGAVPPAAGRGALRGLCRVVRAVLRPRRAGRCARLLPLARPVKDADVRARAGNMRDRNTEDDLAETERVFAVLAARIDIGCSSLQQVSRSSLADSGAVGCLL